MAIDLVWSWIFFATLIPMWRAESSKQVIQSQAMQCLYRIVEHGENITGKIKAEIKATTELQCPLRCHNLLSTNITKFICVVSESCNINQD